MKSWTAEQMGGLRRTDRVRFTRLHRSVPEEDRATNLLERFVDSAEAKRHQGGRMRPERFAMVKWRLGEENVAFHKNPMWTTFKDGRMKSRARMQRLAAEKKDGGSQPKRRKELYWNKKGKQQ
jgi:hypothetical protein